MEVYKKNRLPRVITTLTMLLFVIGLTMNALFCGTYNLYELSDRTNAAESRTNTTGTWATTAETCITVAESWANVAEPWITTAETCTATAETWTSPEGIEVGREAVDAPALRSLLLDKNHPNTGIITKNLCPIPAMAASPKGFCLPLFPDIVLLHFFLTSFIALPDEPTLINQKIRLDN